jgi:hypothetical protein
MRILRNLTLISSLAAVSLCAVGLSNIAFAEIETIAVLDRGEPFEANVFHSNMLWVGKSRKDFNSDYSVEIYADGLQKGRVTFPHSATFMYPYGANSVIVVGTGYSPNLTHYSIIEKNGTNFTVRTKQIPMQAWARQWIGKHNGKEFFTDPGGNQNDPARDNDFSLASQTFFSMSTSSSPRYLTTRLRLPTYGTKVGNKFYVLNAESIGSPQSNLHRLDPATNAITKVFPSFRNALSTISVIPGTNLITLTERGANQFLIVDANSGDILSTTPIAEDSKSHAIMGKCAVIGSRAAKTIQFLDITNPAVPREVMTVAIDLPAGEFKFLDKIDVDTTNYKVFARSNMVCNPMAEACNEDWNRVITFVGETASKIVANCRL